MIPIALCTASETEPRAPTLGMADDDGVSPFDVDMGGAQRAQLRAELRALSAKLRAAHEDASMHKAHVGVMQKLQKEGQCAARIQAWRRVLLQPIFNGWCRHIERARGARSLADETAKTAEKDAQVVALVDRVTRLKANAQMKLSTLSEANRDLASALEYRDAELKAVRGELSARCSEGAERERALLASLSESHTRLAAAEAMVGRLEAGAARRGIEEAAHAGVISEMSARLRAVTLALSTADGQLRAASEAATWWRLCSERLAAQMAGLEAESACLKAEAVAGRTFHDRTSSPADALLPSTAEVEVRGCKRALLASVLISWHDRVAYAKAMRRERQRCALIVHMPSAERFDALAASLTLPALAGDLPALAGDRDSGAAAAADCPVGKGRAVGEGGAVCEARRVLVGEVMRSTLEARFAEVDARFGHELERQRVHARLMAQVAQESEAVASEAEAARWHAFRACQESERGRVIDRAAAAAQLAAERGAAGAEAARLVSRSAVLDALLATTEEERARLLGVSEQLEAELRDGERLLLTIARSHRSVRSSGRRAPAYEADISHGHGHSHGTPAAPLSVGRSPLPAPVFTSPEASLTPPVLVGVSGGALAEAGIHAGGTGMLLEHTLPMADEPAKADQTLVWLDAAEAALHCSAAHSSTPLAESSQHVHHTPDEREAGWDEV